MIATEQHPLRPFLPQNAIMLMLGSFPPKKERWSINFFYPNFQNDMWRIMGTIFFDYKDHFVLDGLKKFDYNKIVDFCTQQGIAIYDTASAVRRLKDNASDKFLEVVEQTNLTRLLAQIPNCQTIVTTGEKATDTIVGQYGCNKPKVGAWENLNIEGKSYRFYRMPSSSRAYPLALQKKAEAYRLMFGNLQM